MDWRATGARAWHCTMFHASLVGRIPRHGVSATVVISNALGAVVIALTIVAPHWLNVLQTADAQAAQRAPQGILESLLASIASHQRMWLTIAVGALVVWNLARANYWRFVELESDRDALKTERDQLEKKIKHVEALGRTIPEWLGISARMTHMLRYAGRVHFLEQAARDFLEHPSRTEEERKQLYRWLTNSSHHVVTRDDLAAVLNEKIKLRQQVGAHLASGRQLENLLRLPAPIGLPGEPSVTDGWRAQQHHALQEQRLGEWIQAVRDTLLATIAHEEPIFMDCLTTEPLTDRLECHLEHLRKIYERI